MICSFLIATTFACSAQAETRHSGPMELIGPIASQGSSNLLTAAQEVFETSDYPLLAASAVEVDGYPYLLVRDVNSMIPIGLATADTASGAARELAHPILLPFDLPHKPMSTTVAGHRFIWGLHSNSFYYSELGSYTWVRQEMGGIIVSYVNTGETLFLVFEERSETAEDDYIASRSQYRIVRIDPSAGAHEMFLAEQAVSGGTGMWFVSKDASDSGSILFYVGSGPPVPVTELDSTNAFPIVGTEENVLVSIENRLFNFDRSGVSTPLFEGAVLEQSRRPFNFSVGGDTIWAVGEQGGEAHLVRIEEGQVSYLKLEFPVADVRFRVEAERDRAVILGSMPEREGSRAVVVQFDGLGLRPNTIELPEIAWTDMGTQYTIVGDYIYFIAWSLKTDREAVVRLKI